MEEQKVTAIIGPNGSGKTRYVDQMRKQLASDKVRYVAFRDTYGTSVDSAYYLQLRWNQHDIDAETPTVAQQAEKAYRLTGPDTSERRQLRDRLYELFALQPLADKYVITLSSGELRKFQLFKSLLAGPEILIIDNPFVGLDTEARDQLRELLRLLAGERRLSIYLVVSREKDVPDFVTSRISLPAPPAPPVDAEALREAIVGLPQKEGDYRADEVVRMNKVSISYGERTILKDLDWTVRNGERWALSGKNGSGKSTLLSLVCADNPQGYACDISLFGHRRGSGESIWDIKKHIGYVSPEMHRAYYRDLPAIRIVASGLKDTVGLYVRPTAAEQETCRWWMSRFGLEGMEQRSFVRLSSGEQRLVLLARAFVKDPELLILDEPLHGLDDQNRLRVKQIIEAFCLRNNKTLLMVTHYEEELPACITHRLVLQRHA